MTIPQFLFIIAVNLFGALVIVIAAAVIIFGIAILLRALDVSPQEPPFVKGKE